MRAVHHKAYIDVYGDDGKLEVRKHFAPDLSDEMREMIRGFENRRIEEHNQLACRQSGPHRACARQSGLADTPLFGTKDLL